MADHGFSAPEAGLSTLRATADGRAVELLDQTRLPHETVFVTIDDLEGAAEAIEVMRVRGAPLIGATAAWGVALAMRHDSSDAGLAAALSRLGRTRPTAVNLHWALARMERALAAIPAGARVSAAAAEAGRVVEEDVAINRAIGLHGLALFREALARKPAGARLGVLTHCNAGWLATCGYGTATAPIYLAHQAGLPVHVYVDETRPRNQGASLTAWELGRAGIPHTVVADNAGGHLMQRGLVDLVVVGTDRVAANGDVANKIGTYLKALAAHDTGVPFYVALPSPTLDFAVASGRDIPIEERAEDEVHRIAGLADDGRIETVRVTPLGARAANPAFDVTPARLVTALLTERGPVAADAAALAAAFPERAGR